MLRTFLNLLPSTVHIDLFAVCHVCLDGTQRRWPSCRSTWPCWGRSTWRCSRGWPTPRGAVPCSPRRPPPRPPPALQTRTPSSAASWSSWPTSINRNTIGEDCPRSKWMAEETTLGWRLFSLCLTLLMCVSFIFSDLKVKVAGDQYCAHKFVLAARTDAWSLTNLASTAELDLTGEKQQLCLWRSNEPGFHLTCICHVSRE